MLILYFGKRFQKNIYGKNGQKLQNFYAKLRENPGFPVFGVSATLAEYSVFGRTLERRFCFFSKNTLFLSMMDCVKFPFEKQPCLRPLLMMEGQIMHDTWPGRERGGMKRKYIIL